MLKLNVRNINNEEVSKVEVPEDVFDYPLREHLVYEAVKNFRANQRSGNASTKTRGKYHRQWKKIMEAERNRKSKGWYYKKSAVEIRGYYFWSSAP